MVATYNGVTFDNVECCSISDYRERCNQVLNIANLYRGGEFKFQSISGQRNKDLENIARLYKEGRMKLKDSSIKTLQKKGYL